MKKTFGNAFLSAAAIALIALGVPAITSGASGPQSRPDGHAQTFAVSNTGQDVLSVGTTKFVATENAQASTSSGVGGSTPHALTPGYLVGKEYGYIPDVGYDGEGIGGGSNPTAPTAPGPGTPGGHHGHGHGHGGNPPSASQDNVSGATPGLASAAGIDAYDQGILHPIGATPTPPGLDIEPPDQGLCSNGSYVMEVNNMVMQVFDARTLQPLGGDGMALERLFTAPEVFGVTGHAGVNVQGDPRCYYDPQSNRWFASQIWLDESGLVTKFGWAGTFVAASETSDPMGAWRVYFIPDMSDATASTSCNNLPATTLPTPTASTGPANPCFGDQPLLGVNGNSVMISTNEYSLYTGTLGGADNVYFLSKSDLLHGIAAPIYWAHPGTVVTRPGAPAANTKLHWPWYSIVPAVSEGAYVTSNDGTMYAMSNVTFTTTGGDQLAVWQFTNTKAITHGAAQITGSVAIATTVSYTEPPFAVQKIGPHPLGTLWKTLTGQTPLPEKTGSVIPGWSPTGEGPVATNTDRVTSAAYDPADGSLWAALNTGVSGRDGSTSGIVWATTTPSGAGNRLSVSRASSGYVSADHVYVQYPSIAFTATGQGLMDYSLSGTAFYPSTAYSFLTSDGPTGIHLARSGAGPTDGFTEYTATYARPRWGDYSTALASGSTFYFAAEMVNQRCTVSQFEATFTCGGTRDIEANWGTSVNSLPASQGRGHGH